MLLQQYFSNGVTEEDFAYSAYIESQDPEQDMRKYLLVLHQCQRMQIAISYFF